MSRPVRTTIIFALLSGPLVVAGAWLLRWVLPWPMAFKLALWMDLAIYTVLLARWSRTALSRIIFPLAILFGIAVWPQTELGFFVLTMGMLSWIRSGICYNGHPVRSLMAEVAAITGAGGLVWLLGGQTAVALALDIGLFWLVQSLYFFIIPYHHIGQREGYSTDPFETAMEGAANLLDES